MKEREWARVTARNGYRSKWSDLRHVLAELDPYSGYGTTVCGRDISEPWAFNTDPDLAASLERDGIPLDLCPKCDRLTR